jgi:hypothetical protein
MFWHLFIEQERQVRAMLTTATAFYSKIQLKLLLPFAYYFSALK